MIEWNRLTFRISEVKKNKVEVDSELEELSFETYEFFQRIPLPFCVTRLDEKNVEFALIDKESRLVTVGEGKLKIKSGGGHVVILSITNTKEALKLKTGLLTNFKLTKAEKKKLILTHQKHFLIIKRKRIKNKFYIEN